MRITIAVIGRLKDGPERDLYRRYADRYAAHARALGLAASHTVELPESRAQRQRDRQRDETQRLLAAIATDATRYFLTEAGRQMTSDAFAKKLGRLRDDGVGNVAFLIGGPDGHDPDMLDAHRQTLLSLGQMTFPHGLARVLLAEQLYRAVTILAGHPYHRA
ncbi:MAG: 23S rRNA (pseudouridine(1915)-N(3))-methyltransferase RlmH [Pseudomonadota bacterium]